MLDTGSWDSCLNRSFHISPVVSPQMKFPEIFSSINLSVYGKIKPQKLVVVQLLKNRYKILSIGTLEDILLKNQTFCYRKYCSRKKKVKRKVG